MVWLHLQRPHSARNHKVHAVKRPNQLGQHLNIKHKSFIVKFVGKCLSEQNRANMLTKQGIGKHAARFDAVDGLHRMKNRKFPLHTSAA
jgi:hypothetical protein